MSGLGFELQKALIAAVAADAAVISRQAGVHDFVPDTAALPYVRVAVVGMRPWDAKTFRGGDYTARIDVWTDALNRAAVLDLSDSITQTLQTATITVPGGRIVYIRHEFAEILADPDGVALHGVLRFRIVAHHDLA